MPQRNLFDSTLDWTGVRVQITDHTPNLVASFTTTLQVKREDGDWSSLHVLHWRGLMVDFLGTYVSEVMNAWLYGTPKDVIKVSKKVQRDAGRHAVAHAYD